MKQLLVIRFPLNYAQDAIDMIIGITEKRLPNYDIIYTVQLVNEITHEIIYNPHFKHEGESIDPAEPFKVEL